MDTGNYFSEFFALANQKITNMGIGPGRTFGSSTGVRSLPQVLSEFDAYLLEISNRNLTPGMAVAVIVGNETVYTRCIGVKKVGSVDPVDEDTVFQIGSNSKPMTGAVIARLVEEGVLDWDDRIVTYYPDFSLWDTYAGEHITFRDALSHRSGLPSHAGGELMTPFEYNASEILYRIRYLEPATDFRTVYEYQNVIYLLAGEAAARHSGKDWADLAEDSLFGPLGMHSTSARFSDFVTAQNRAFNHYETNGTFEVVDPLDYDAFAPAGGVSSTLRDMSRWVQFQVNLGNIEGEQILSPEIISETHSIQTVIASDDTYVSGYGLGWYSTFLDDGLIIDHGGSTTSSTSYVMILPSEKIGIVVLCNKGIAHSLPMAVAYTFRQTYLHGPPQRDLYTAFKATIDPAFDEIYPVDELPDPQEGALPPLPLERYTGRYYSEYYGNIRIDEAAGGLELYFGQNVVPSLLEPWDGDTFRDVSSMTAVNFTVGDNGSASKVFIGMLHFNRRNGTFVSV